MNSCTPTTLGLKGLALTIVNCWIISDNQPDRESVHPYHPAPLEAWIPHHHEKRKRCLTVPWERNRVVLKYSQLQHSLTDPYHVTGADFHIWVISILHGEASERSSKHTLPSKTHAEGMLAVLKTVSLRIHLVSNAAPSAEPGKD